MALLFALIHQRSTTLPLIVGGDCEAGDWWDVTDAELEVFGLDDALYPLCIAALDAYTAFSGEGGKLDGHPLIVAARAERPDLAQATPEAEAFAAFAAATVGLDAEDAWKAWGKQQGYYLRHGLIGFDRCSELARERDQGMHRVRRLRRFTNSLGPLARLLLPIEDNQMQGGRWGA
ncbi:hypothetical protein E2C06_12375 [Dankookia rubra]|uniref:Uncharacterized protein n=1 Tax=Dankookia rubra TaxID=1442381 RepID=A0A4R5QH17_9PROT|nr:hypothetical protein [Dankookia rubra]TDH62396.1 hypothetical protein E2C06_12375 [Dankookia rubra]